MMLKNHLWKRCLCLCLVMILVSTALPVEGWYIAVKKVEAANQDTINYSDKLTSTHIPDTRLLTIIKELVIKELQKDASYQVTLGDLINYTGKIDLKGEAVTDITGIGFARNATEFDLSTLTITSINSYEFYLCKMRTVILPETITEIKSNAFQTCDKLESINLPQKVSNIGASAFQGCTSLNGVTLPTDIKVIEKDAFNSCYALKTMIIPNAKVELGASVFSGCKGLESIELPEGMKTIPTEFLKGTSSMKSLTIPTTVTEIASNSFLDCGMGISSVDLTKCTVLKKIGTYAFAGSDIYEIKLPESLETIEGLAFNVSSIEKMVLPESLTILGTKAFKGSYIEEITLPSNLLEIAEETFSECKYLNRVTIKDRTSNKIQSIGKKAFSNCSSLPNTEFLLDMKSLKTIEEEAFSNCNYVTNPMKYDIYGRVYYEGKFRSVVLPDNIILGKSVFAGNRNLKLVKMGKGILNLPETTFKDCWNLVKVELSEDLEKIGNSSFENCYQLSDITFPKTSLKEIGNSAFKACGDYKGIATNSYYTIKGYVPKDRISNTRSNIDTSYEVFAIENITTEARGVETASFEQVQRKYIDLPEVSSLAVFTNSELEVKYLYALSDLMQPTKSLDDDVEIFITISRDVIDKVVSTLGSPISKFAQNDPTYVKVNQNGQVFMGLEKVELPDSVTLIGTGVFENCVNLKEVKLSKEIRTIPERAFSQQSVTVLKKRDGLQVDKYAFSGLKKVVLPAGLKEIGNYAFYKNAALNLENGELPSTLERIGDYAFSECSSLTKILIPNSLQHIGNYAFSKAACIGEEELSYQDPNTSSEYKMNIQVPMDSQNGLNEIDFIQARNLGYIGTGAFAYTSLIQCNLPSSVKRIEASLFEGCKFLRNVTTRNTLEFVGAKAFAHTQNMQTVSLPATAVLDPTMFDGFINPNTAVTLNNDENKELSVAYGNKIELPVYSISEGNRNEDGLVVTLDNDEGVIGKEKSTKTFSFFNKPVDIYNITGLKLEPSETDITVNCKMGFKGIGKRTIITNQELKYKVKVVEVKCESIAFDRDLYAVSIADTTNGITLSPEITPKDTTEDFRWEATNQDNVVGIDVITRQNPAGKTVNTAEAKIIPKGYGTSKVTLKTSDKQDSCNVNVVVPAQNITLSKSEYNFYLDMEGKEADQIQPNITYSSSYASDKIRDYPDILFYSSSNKDVVTVDSDGYLKATGIGDAVITVTAQGGKRSVTCNVKVYPENTDVSLYHDDITLDKDTVKQLESGDEITLDIKTQPIDSLAPLTYDLGVNANNVIMYKRFNTTPITTSGGKSGNKEHQIVLTAKAPGTTIVSVMSKVYEGNVTDLNNKSRVTLQVTADATEIQLNKASSSLDIGQTKSFFKLVTSKAGSTSRVEDIATITSDTVKFKSSNTAVAVVDENTGEVKGISAGSTTISVVSSNSKGGSVRDDFLIDVKAPIATVVNIQGPAVINIGETVRYTSKLTPIEAVNPVTFEAYNEQSKMIVNVLADGTVTGLEKGVATIKATTDNGVYTYFNITVNKPSTKINVINKKVELNVGQIYSLRLKADYTILPEDTTDTITWESKQKNIASVDTYGTVKAVAKGIATIVGTTTSGVKGEFTINVAQPATSINVAKEITINIGKKKKLAANRVPSSANESLIWSSGNTNIAKVDQTGTITALAKGVCDIIISTKSGVSAYCRVIVTVPSKSIKIQTISASFKQIYLEKKGSYSLYAVMSPIDTTDIVKWTTSNKKVAAVDVNTGLVQAKKKGKATITAKATSGKKISIKVNVVSKKAPAKKVTIAKKKTVKVKKIVRIAPKLTKKTSTDTLIWYSSNTTVATVDGYGNITTLKKGKVNIIVNTSSGKSATCKLTVK